MAKTESEKAIERYKRQKEVGLYDPNMEYHEEQDVKSGAWVLVTRTVPVAEEIRPHLYGIYWGMMNEDRYGRQSCRIFTSADVILLNHEYTVIDEERLKVYKEEGWELRQTHAKQRRMDMEMIERGRSLAEEEREIIWALQLDGLSEEQACEEYFLTHHTDDSNFNICYIPRKDVFETCLAWFGER